MGFSYNLDIAGYNIQSFGEMKIVQNTEGFGTSGVCTSEFTFSMDAEEYGGYAIPASAEVRLSMEENYSFAPTYYIATRRRQGGKVSFKCYDRMVYTDQTCDTSLMGFDSNGRATSQNVAAGIAVQCGFEGLFFATEFVVLDFYIKKEDVEGKTCRTLLEMISKAWCGVFRASRDEKLLFIAFGLVYYLTSAALEHAQISEGGIKGPIQYIYVTDGKNEYSAGNSGADVFGTLKIQTEYASQALASNLWSRLEGYTYEAWSCERCIVDNGYGDIEINAKISFGDGSARVANNITKYITAQGIFVSCSCNDVVENEFDYLGALTRKIETKIGDGEELGNKTMVTRYQGIVHIGEKITDENGKETQNRYGYSPATASGLVEFDGAMVSKVTPTGASFSEDGKEAIINYEGKAYRYNLNYDSSGNVTSFVKTEVT